MSENAKKSDKKNSKTMTETRLAEIKNAEKRVIKVETHWVVCKVDVAEAKRAFDKAIEELRSLIREEMPLLDGA
ncbi:unnamed protein product [marine sediment metagenome]|uniref:Uncharacterized protein n=1 Tax=marine sediment metagenome TaxID=412755 RepID=X0T6C7_9ZZZZ